MFEVFNLSAEVSESRELSRQREGKVKSSSNTAAHHKIMKNSSFNSRSSSRQKKEKPLLLLKGSCSTARTSSYFMLSTTEKRFSFDVSKPFQASLGFSFRLFNFVFVLVFVLLNPLDSN